MGAQLKKQAAKKVKPPVKKAVKKKSHKKAVIRGGTPGNTKDKIDRNLLHEYLWKQADSRNHRLMIQQTRLAEGLQVTQYTMARIFGEMLASGQLRRVRGVYYVVDPDLWKWRNASPEVPWDD